MKAAFVTLLTKTSYLAGALVLHQSLLDVQSKYPLVIMVTPLLPTEARRVLLQRGIAMIEVDSLQPAEGSHTLDAMDARFADTWTKLRRVNVSQSLWLRSSLSYLRVFSLIDYDVSALHLAPSSFLDRS